MRAATRVENLELMQQTFFQTMMVTRMDNFENKILIMLFLDVNQFNKIKQFLVHFHRHYNYSFKLGFFAFPAKFNRDIKMHVQKKICTFIKHN